MKEGDDGGRGDGTRGDGKQWSGGSGVEEVKAKRLHSMQKGRHPGWL